MMGFSSWVKPHLRPIGRVPVLGRGLVLLYRLLSNIKVLTRTAWYFLFWLIRSREYTNLTYRLTQRNEAHLACFVAEVTGITFVHARQYLNELNNDVALTTHIQDCITNSEDGCFADLDVRFGRRSGWYAIVRALKPRIVVETGIDKGLGACVLTAALLRNAEEGKPGYYYGTDINPKAGYLLQGRYAQAGQILYGDSIQSLKELPETIDLFINDSDHSAEYEAREYETVEIKLSRQAVVLGDNAHLTDALLRFSIRTGRSFLYFQEKPQDHWYPGDGIGIAFHRISSDLL